MPPANGNGTAREAPHAQFVQEIKDLMTSTAAIADHLKVLTTAFQAVVATSPEAKQDLLESSSQLSQTLAASTTTLRDCLADLATMGEAMAPVMESSPEASPALIVNLYSTFFRQLKAYYRDVNDNFGDSSTAFERGRAAFYREQFTTSTAAATAAAAADPIRSLPDTPKQSQLPPPSDTSAAPTLVNTPAKKKKKHKVLLEDELSAGLEADGAGLGKGAATSTLSKATEGEAPGFALTPSHEDPEVAALAAAAAVGGAQNARRGKTRKALSGGDTDDMASAAAHVPLRNEPAYLLVRTSVEDALGRVILGSRPNFFSNVDAFLRRQPVASYYIRLVQPGSLALFVVKNYINMDEDAQADLFCDVLETDTVEVDPVECVDGEVIVEDEQDLRELPVSAWRVGNNEDHTRLLYTTYMLVEAPGTALGRAALIQDSFVSASGQREEVLHTVALVDVAPRFARVTVYALGGRGGSGGSKASAIASLSRGNFAVTGFTEASEADVLEAVPRSKRDSSTLLQELRTVSSAAADATETFHPHVQLASLDTPAKQARPNLTMGDVTRGVLRGGVEVLKAPLTVGRVVGGAVMDVTGASDAIRNSVEGVFRKAFPTLVEEPVLDSFNCAWQEGSMAKQGYLFVTVHWVCFAGTVTNAQFSMEYDEIKDVRKCRTAMFDNAIELATHVGDKFFIANFVNRDQAYTMIMQQWLK